MSVTEYIKKMMAPLRQRVLLMISRAVVKIVMDDEGMQKVQISVLKDEVLDKVERFQNFGFTSKPKPGAEAVLACVGGNRNHPIVIVVDDKRYRKTDLQEGEAAIYNSEGDYIHVKADGTIEIKASGVVTLDCPTVHLTGNLIVDGTSTLTGLVTATAGVTAPGGVATGTPSSGQVGDSTGTMSGMRTIYNGHTHPQEGGGTTDAPTEQM